MTEEKKHTAARKQDQKPCDPYIRAENEDDDGYDPYSDRRPEPEPLFERDPWASPLPIELLKKPPQQAAHIMFC